MQARERKQERGFTLIELLVVVAIISLLSSIALSSLNAARSRARDTARKAELRELRIALENYFNTNGSYPSTGGAWYSSESGDANSTNGGNWIPGLSPGYISSLPRDPRGGTSTLCGAPWKSAYNYFSDGSNYKLLSHCAPENAWTSADSFYDLIRPTWAWKICSGEPACSSW